MQLTDCCPSWPLVGLAKSRTRHAAQLVARMSGDHVIVHGCVVIPCHVSISHGITHARHEQVAAQHLRQSRGVKGAKGSVGAGWGQGRGQVSMQFTACACRSRW